MTFLDWLIIIVYLLAIIGLGWVIGRQQKSQDDYYLAGEAISSWQIALSILATQVSAISLISAPAFIALRTGGGLTWLQYEFAIPLAMMLIMLLHVPIYHRARGITIYEYLERRFGGATRTILSAVFLVSRALGAGVALLATAIVTSVCLDWPLYLTILLIGGVSIIYTTFGGIKADIYSDIIQLFLLWAGSFGALLTIWKKLSGQALSFLASEPDRLRIFNFSATGLGDGETFAFWPMIIGGFFLYLSYYGCDQSQAQRLLTSKTFQEAQKALFLNGLLRFPLVLTYCTFGVLLIAFLQAHPEFARRLEGQPPDFLVPFFLVEHIPEGIRGLIIAGLFAASMSSLDSALNSLSAATYRDFLLKIFPRLQSLSNKKEVFLSRLLTISWGVLATSFALQIGEGSETVIELVNKIGSAFYGPVLAVFWLGMFFPRANQRAAIIGLLAGLLLNLNLWLFLETKVSWLWWNVFGFGASFLSGLVLSFLTKPKEERPASIYLVTRNDLSQFVSRRRLYFFLLIFFILIIVFSQLIETILK